MVQANPGVAPFDSGLPYPESGALSDPLQRFALFADLMHVVTWELEIPGDGAVWHSPAAGLFGDDMPSGSFLVRRARDSEESDPFVSVAPEDLGDALLEPLVTGANTGITWDSYELLQEVESPDGETHRVLVRAVAIPDQGMRKFLGIVADVTHSGEVPWVTVDVTRRLELLVEHSPDAIVVHQDGRIVYANPAAAKIVGEDLMSDMGKPISSYLHPDYVRPTLERLTQLTEPGDAMKGHEAVIIRADGAQIPVEVASVRTSWGGKPAFQVIMRDMSERKLAEEAARARLALERRYAAAVAALEEGVVVMDRSGTVRAANESAVRMLGRRLHEAKGDAIFTGSDVARHDPAGTFSPDELPIAAALERGQVTTNVVLGVRDDEGRDQWLSVSARPLEDQDDNEAAVVTSVSDITERKQLMDRLAWEARHDPLTGLANRTSFVAAAQRAHDLRHRTGQTLALFCFDLDRFKLVNDSLGHAVGNEVLLMVAERLRQAMPCALALCRLHGDEFAALEPGVSDTDTALQRAEELCARLTQPMRLSTGRTLTITPSVGVVLFEDGPADAASLLQDADMAMLQAKTRGRGRVAVFDAGLREEVGQRLELEHDLRSAIGNGELRLEYQPVASLSSGKILGMEALVRWEHPEKGLLLPLKFIGLAEESDLIVSLGRWVLETGCTQMARWRAVHPQAEHAFLAVNVSPRQLESAELLPALREALQKSELPAGALMLEITESGIVADDTRMHRLLNELREFGVRLAIDDFGTGYSSLSYLKRLPVSHLKIDRSFVNGLGTDTEDERIVAAVTELGHGLGLRVVAEGIENRQQRQRARELGCDLYQGFLLAKPCRPRDVPALLRLNA
jgi:diguanylate cyclase (GGDEF)-like protein/PAS domain S-box-containing protein